MERRKSEKLGVTTISKNTFMYSTDGFKSKTFSSTKLHKKVFNLGKNTESNNCDYLASKLKGKSHRREESIRNCFKSQIIFS